MTELPAAWGRVSLRDLLATPLANGRSVKDRPGGFPVLRLTAIRNGGVDLRESKEGDWEAADALRFCVEPGDLLIVRGNGSLDLVGRSGLVGMVDTRVAYPDTLIRARVDQDLVEPRYLNLALSSPHVRRQIESSARTTAGIYKINQGQVGALIVPLPLLAEQRRIVDILEDHLSRLDAGRNLADLVEKRITRLRQVARQQAVDSADSRMTRLAELIDKIETGKSLGGSAAPAAADEWGIIKVSAMTWGEFRPEENKRIPEMLATPAYEIRPGDLLVSRANTSAYVGASVLVGDVRPRLLLSDKSLRLVPRAGVDAAWLNEVLQAPRSRAQISALATGTKDSMRNISQSALLSIEVPQTPPEEQGRVLARTREIGDALDNLNAAVARTKTREARLRRALLDAAFAGRLTGSSSDTERVEELVEAGV